MNSNQASLGKKPSFLGVPRTSVGWWSVGLAVAFDDLFALWGFRVTPPPLSTLLILSAAASAIAGAIVGLLAFILKRERSVLIMLSTLIGAFVLFWTIGEAMGG